MCKSYLMLGKETRSISYDALTAHTAIVFARYMMLALEQRRNMDERSLGELFYLTDRRAGRPALSGRSGLTPEPVDGLR